MARRDWESWDPGLISSLAQWVKDLALPQLWLRPDHWPVSSKCYGAAKKKKKKIKRSKIWEEKIAENLKHVVHRSNENG